MTHPVQVVRVSHAVSLAAQPRVPRGLVDRSSAAKVMQPRLDVPARHDNENPITVVSPRNLLLIARRIQLRPAVRGRVLVRIRDDNQVGILPSADGLQLIRISFSHPLLTRLGPASHRTPHPTAPGGSRSSSRPSADGLQIRISLTCMDIPAPEVAAPQKPAHERIRLRVLAEEGDADSAHSRSQPRATVSESEMPSTVRSGSLLTRTGPFASR